MGEVTGPVSGLWATLNGQGAPKIYPQRCTFFDRHMNPSVPNLSILWHSRDASDLSKEYMFSPCSRKGFHDVVCILPPTSVQGRLCQTRLFTTTEVVHCSVVQSWGNGVAGLA